MSNGYGCDGISTATAERELGLDGRGIDENTLQAAIEEQAEDEMREGARLFSLEGARRFAARANLNEPLHGLRFVAEAA